MRFQKKNLFILLVTCHLSLVTALCQRTRVSTPTQTPPYDSGVSQIQVQSATAQTGDIQDWGPTVTQTLGTGDGVTKVFTPTLSSTPVMQTSISITVSGTNIVILDDGHGFLFGPGLTIGSVNYSTGAVSLTFTKAPASGASIVGIYGQVFTYIDSGGTLHGGGSGIGTVTSFSAGNLSPIFTSSVATPTTTPALTFTLSNAGAGTIFGNPTGAPAPPSFFTPTPGQIGSGTVTSFSAGALSPLFTTSVATPTTTPALTFSPVSQAQNLVFASPDGAPGNPTFRALTANDLVIGGAFPTLNQVLDPTADKTFTMGGHALNFSYGSGDIPAPLMTFGDIVGASSLLGNQSNFQIMGTDSFVTNNSQTLAVGAQESDAGASNFGAFLAVASPSNASGTLSTVKAIQATAVQGGAGTTTNLTGTNITAAVNAGSVTNLRGLNIDNVTGGSNNYAIQTGSGLNHFGDRVGIGADPAAGIDLDISSSAPNGGTVHVGSLTANRCVQTDGSTPPILISTAGACPGAGGGSVTTFSSGNLSPLFTTSVATPSTTPTQSFTLSNAGAGTIFGNPAGAPAAPSFFTPSAGQVGSGTVTSVTGTANQIDVVSPTTTPVVSLDSALITPGSATISGLLSAAASADINATDLRISVPNDGVTGTTLNKLAKVVGNTAIVLTTSVSDQVNAVGCVDAGAGTSGSAHIAIVGQVSCYFDNTATVIDDYVVPSGVTAATLTDVGATYPTSGEVLGQVKSTNAPCGAPPCGPYTVLFMTPNIAAQGAGNSGGGKGTSVFINGGPSKGVANFNSTTPAATPGNLNIPFTSSNSGNTTSVAVSAAISGNTGTLATTSGTLTNGHAAKFDSNGNIVDAGAAPATGTVTSIATTSPITGGPITTTGTIACATCVTGSSLTNGQLISGTGGQGIGVTDLSGDCTTSGSTATTCTKINGLSVPASTNLLSTNSSSQIVAATAHNAAVPLTCAAASASGTTYTCTTAPTFTPADHDVIHFEADVANTGAATLNVNSSGAANIKKQGGATALAANDLLAGQETILVYDGTQWQMQGQLGNPVPGGSGTTNFIPKWTAATTLGNSAMDDGVTTLSTITATSESVAVAVPASGNVNSPNFAMTNSVAGVNHTWKQYSHGASGAGGCTVNGTASVCLDLDGTNIYSFGGNGTLVGANSNSTLAMPNGGSITLHANAGQATLEASANLTFGSGNAVDTSLTTIAAGTMAWGSQLWGFNGAWSRNASTAAMMFGTTTSGSTAAGDGGFHVWTVKTGDASNTAPADSRDYFNVCNNGDVMVGVLNNSSSTVCSFLFGAGKNEGFNISCCFSGLTNAQVNGNFTVGSTFGANSLSSTSTIVAGTSSSAATFLTATNCQNSGGTCTSAAAGMVSIAAAATTVTVSTTAVTANSEIFIQEDSTLGTALSVTCNTTIARTYAVTTRTAGTSFVITASAAPVTNPACLSYHIIN